MHPVSDQPLAVLEEGFDESGAFDGDIAEVQGSEGKVGTNYLDPLARPGQSSLGC